MGTSPEELGQLLRRVRSRRVMACLDTAHAYAAGELDPSPEGVKDLIKKWERHIGLRRLLVIHANDSQTSFGSAADRHENIGRGHIGLKGFRCLAKERDLWGADWILEVPGFKHNGPDKENLEILKKCFR